MSFGPGARDCWIAKPVLVVTAGLFVFDQLFGLGPIPTLALFVGAVLYVVLCNPQENGSRAAFVVLLALPEVAALELLDSGVLPVLRIS